MSTTSTTPALAARDAALKFADEYLELHTALSLSRAAFADVKKRTEANKFWTVHWDTFEEGPIDSTEVLSKLETDIKEKEGPLAVAKTGLEEALERMHEGEIVVWWKACARTYSDLSPLEEWKSFIPELVVEEEPAEELVGEESWVKIAVGESALGDSGGEEFSGGDDEGKDGGDDECKSKNKGEDEGEEA